MKRGRSRKPGPFYTKLFYYCASLFYVSAGQASAAQLPLPPGVCGAPRGVFGAPRPSIVAPLRLIRSYLPRRALARAI